MKDSNIILMALLGLIALIIAGAVFASTSYRKPVSQRQDHKVYEVSGKFGTSFERTY